jgi:Regulator of chromosome condensation (RCC1) repeat
MCECCRLRKLTVSVFSKTAGGQNMNIKATKNLPVVNVMAIILIMPLMIFATHNKSEAIDPQIAAGGFHSVGLKSDRSVVAVGDNDYGQLNVSNWKITQVNAGRYHTIGLKADGSVLAVGRNAYGELNVSSWSDIVQIAGGNLYTVGLKSGGTVLAVGQNDSGQTNVRNWSDITKVAAGDAHTVGLKSDGTVVAVGSNEYFQINVSSWSNIRGIAAGGFHTVGLKQDGTVVAVGCRCDPNDITKCKNFGQCEVDSWNNIVQVAAGLYHTVGLKADGTVVAVGNNGNGERNVTDWKDMVQVAATYFHTLGLKSDGTVVAAGLNNEGQGNVSNWRLRQSSPPPPPPLLSPASPWIPLLLPDETRPSELIQNGNFEFGHSAWTEYSEQPGYEVITTTFPAGVTPHSGSYAVWQGGVNDNTKYIRQSVTVSADSPYLTFYHWIASADSCGYDYGYIRINGVNRDTLNLCSSSNTSGWVPRSINLNAYSGQTVLLEFRSETDSSLNSNWFIDDVSFRIN